MAFDILYSVSKVGLLPPHIIAHTYQTVKFYCESDEEVEWKFLGGIIPTNVKLGRRKKQNLSWLRIENVAIGNAGIYMCSVQKNNFTILQKWGELHVVRKPNDNS